MTRELPRDSVARSSEFWSTANLGDPRRARRAAGLTAAMAQRPSAPLPAALGCDADVQGCYRLVNNRRVTFHGLEAVAGEVASQRAEESGGDVLVLHDTTDCGFPHLDPDEIGYLNTGKAGFRLHASLVIDANHWRCPLGVVASQTLHRDKPRRSIRTRKASGVETATWKDKEYARWYRGIEVSHSRLANCRSVVHVADRESDSYDLMASTLALGARFVFRVRVSDRRGREATDGGGAWSKVGQVARKLEGQFEREVPLSARKAKPTPRTAYSPRRARSARLQFAATGIEVPRPRYVGAEAPATLELNLVHVREIDVPDGEPAVEWLLYTTEDVATASAVERVVDIYRSRWLSEEFHAALKGGCAFESREFESRHALLNMLVLTMPIACEVLALRSAARDDTPRPATDVLSPEQLQILRRAGSYRLSDTPTAAEALLAVAALGGHLKRNGPPGWRVISRGMTELSRFESAAARADEGADL